MEIPQHAYLQGFQRFWKLMLWHYFDTKVLSYYADL
jgi:hypothetical protein